MRPPHWRIDQDPVESRAQLVEEPRQANHLVGADRRFSCRNQVNPFDRGPVKRECQRNGARKQLAHPRHGRDAESLGTGTATALRFDDEDPAKPVSRTCDGEVGDRARPSRSAGCRDEQEHGCTGRRVLGRDPVRQQTVLPRRGVIRPVVRDQIRRRRNDRRSNVTGEKLERNLRR